MDEALAPVCERLMSLEDENRIQRAPLDAIAPRLDAISKEDEA